MRPIQQCERLTLQRFEQGDEQGLAARCVRPDFEVERGCGSGEVGIEAALVDVDADADDRVGRRLLDSSLASTRMPPVLRGPMSRSLGQRRSTARPAAACDGVGGGEAGDERQQRQACEGNLRAQQDADVEALAGGGMPGVIAAAAAG